MSDDFVYFEPLENGYLISIFQFEKLVIGNGSIEYTSYCLDDEGEPTIDNNDFMDFGKNCTLSEYEQLFKKRHKGRKLNNVQNGLYQLLTKQWKRIQYNKINTIKKLVNTISINWLKTLFQK